MSDISKCMGGGCDRKFLCLRFTQAPRVKWQSYLVMQVSIKDVEACKYFIDSSEIPLTPHPTPFSIKP